MDRSPTEAPIVSGYRKFCEPCERTVEPAADGDCPHCGAGLTPIPRERNPREKNDDDGIEYGHPRDRRDGLE